LINSL
jgi:hypothetical protein